MGTVPTKPPALDTSQYREYLEDLVRRGDEAALAAELAKVQLTRQQLDALVSRHSGARDWSSDDVDLFEPQPANGDEQLPPQKQPGGDGARTVDGQ